MEEAKKRYKRRVIWTKISVTIDYMLHITDVLNMPDIFAIAVFFENLLKIFTKPILLMLPKFFQKLYPCLPYLKQPYFIYYKHFILDQSDHFQLALS